MKTASISKLSAVQKSVLAAMTLSVFSTAAIAQTDFSRFGIKNAPTIEAPAFQAQVQNTEKTLSKDAIILLKRDKENHGNQGDGRDDHEDNNVNKSKKCTIDMTTGVANWQIGGSTAPVITPYVYWSHGVELSTMTTSAVKWINNNSSNVSPAGTYVYELNFNVPKKCANKKLIFEGIFSADNDATVDVVQGSNVYNMAHTILAPHYGFMNGHQGVFNQTLNLSAGSAKMKATVTNVSSYSGFTMRAKMHP